MTKMDTPSNDPNSSGALEERQLPASPGMGSWSWLGIAVVLAAALLWGYWPTVLDLVKVWRTDEDFSAGQIVPFLALFFVWNKRGHIRACRIAPCWWGLGLIAFAQLARLGGNMFYFRSAVGYSLPLTICGILLGILGPSAVYRMRWILAFTFLMVPPPTRVHLAISGALQSQATAATASLLNLLGVEAGRQGNVVQLVDGNIQIGVLEACSGLRMLMAFVVVAATVVFMINCPRWQKLVLLISSVPLAIACNLFRLCTTACLYVYASSETAERFFHDLAGFAMMPLAILLLLGEYLLINKVRSLGKPPPSSSRQPPEGAS